MARSLNKQILLGNVGADPVIKVFDGGAKRATLNLATSTTWRDKATGERKENTVWHRLVFRDRLAEVVERFVVKGSEIYIEGPIRHRRFKSQDKEKSISEILVRELALMGGGSGSSANPSSRTTAAAPAPEPPDDAGDVPDSIVPDDVDLGFDDGPIPF